MIVNENTLNAAAEALITCANSATDFAGLKVVFDISHGDARKLILAALVSADKYGEGAVISSSTSFFCNGVVWPPAANEKQSNPNIPEWVDRL